MVFQKRPFILIEVFIAIALLTLCAFPLINSSLKAYYYQRDHLIELELERQAELYFYKILNERLHAYSFDEIPPKSPSWVSLDPLNLKLDGIEATFYPHYHIHYNQQSKSEDCKKVWCWICFSKKKDVCSKIPYKFAFLVKKVAEKSVDPHGDVKEKSLTEHERSTSDVQALRSSE